MSARLVKFKDLDNRGNNAREASVFEIKTRLSWRTLMRLASVASMAALATLLVGSANAMPTPAPYRGDSSITLAAGGCGPAYHRNVYGGCVPNGWGGGVVVAPGFYGGGYGYHGGYYHGGGATITAGVTITGAATITAGAGMAAAGTVAGTTGTTAVFTAGDRPRAQSLTLRPKTPRKPGRSPILSVRCV